MAASTTLDVKSSFLKNHALKLCELAKRQSDYRRALATRLKNFRRGQIMESNLKKTIKRLKKERSDIKTQVWTATGSLYRKENAKYEKEIKCHIKCEEKLADDIQVLKGGIDNLKRELGRISREIYELNQNTVPDSRAIENAKRARKRLLMRENLLEVGIHRECKMTAENAKLREELIEALNMRKYFNDHYLKLIQELNSDKKYMTDLIGYAMHQFDSSIELYEKFDVSKKREDIFVEQKKLEMRDISRTKTLNANELECARKKTSPRKLADLPPKEYLRRERMREDLKKKLNLNKSVLDKIFEFTGQKDITAVIERFKQQEGLYYSYFNYANETSYHMTLLNNAVNRLYSDIDNIKYENRSLMQNQLEQILTMEQTLEDKRKSNDILRSTSMKNDERLGKLFEGFKLIRDHTRTKWDSLLKKLGQYEDIDILNLRDELKLVQNRIIGVLSAVYTIERQAKKKDYLVKELEKICDWTTALDDVVLTQQCPECAEVDALNIDEAEGATIMDMETLKKKLYDKIIQPEMQYRLHSISTCRFPRARMLTAKRDLELLVHHSS